MAIALVTQNAGTIGTEAGSTTQTVTLTANVLAADTVILTVGGGAASAAITSVTDNGPGRTWTVDAAEVAAPLANADAWIVRGVGGAMSSGQTITVTWGGTQFVRSIGVSVFSGIDNAGTPVNATSVDVTVDPAATGWASGSIGVLAGGMVFAVAQNESGNTTSTPTSPAVEAHDFAIASAPSAITSAYRLEAGAGTVSVAGTWSGSVKTTIVAVAYNASAGAAATSFPPVPSPSSLYRR